MINLQLTDTQKIEALEEVIYEHCYDEYEYIYVLYEIGYTIDEVIYILKSDFGFSDEKAEDYIRRLKEDFGIEED